jgi:hypothetical protein
MVLHFCIVGFCISIGLVISASAIKTELAVKKPLRTVVDLQLGETKEVTLHNDATVNLSLIDMGETLYPPTKAVVKAWVKISVNGQEIVLWSGNYHLPITVDNVQIDCPITRSYYSTSSRDMWLLKKDARLRLWPAGSPLLTPGTFVYPVKQKWFASKTQMCNEPTFVDGGSFPKEKIYYHNGLDFGGAEGMVDVLSATDGLVVFAGDSILVGYENSPMYSLRPDVIYIKDDRDWFYRYSHLWATHPGLKTGMRINMGQKIGILGKEGASGGWSHLHFDIKSKQPSGEWGTEEGYAYIWEAYLNQYNPDLIAIARPHQFAHVGDKVSLESKKSWVSTGEIVHFEWQLSNTKVIKRPRTQIIYNQPGQYSEILKITDDKNNINYDFAVVTVIDTSKSPVYQIPPTVHIAYFPTFNIGVNEPVTFFIRSFDTKEGNEVIDFDDGSPPVTVYSNTGYYENVIKYIGLDEKFLRDFNHIEGYAQAVHSFKEAGHYVIKASHTADNGYTATTHVHVAVGNNTN